MDKNKIEKCGGDGNPDKSRRNFLGLLGVGAVTAVTVGAIGETLCEATEKKVSPEKYTEGERRLMKEFGIGHIPWAWENIKKIPREKLKRYAEMRLQAEDARKGGVSGESANAFSKKYGFSYWISYVVIYPEELKRTPAFIFIRKWLLGNSARNFLESDAKNLEDYAAIQAKQ